MVIIVTTQLLISLLGSGRESTRSNKSKCLVNNKKKKHCHTVSSNIHHEILTVPTSPHLLSLSTLTSFAKFGHP